MQQPPKHICNKKHLKTIVFDDDYEKRKKIPTAKVPEMNSTIRYLILPQCKVCKKHTASMPHPGSEPIAL